MRNRAIIVALVLGLGAATVALGAASWWAPQAPPSQTSLEHLGNYGVVPPFVLTERSGRQLGLADLRGLVWVADFIYTECTESCPTQSLELARLAQEFAAVPDLRLVSITVDPMHDTPEVLRRYAERYGANDRWWFLTGERREIYCLARDGFRLSVVDPRATAPGECGRALRFGPAAAWASHGAHGIVMHSARVVLVDGAGRIRAYHLATEPDSMRTLRSNLRIVLGEPRGRRKAMNSSRRTFLTALGGGLAVSPALSRMLAAGNDAPGQGDPARVRTIQLEAREVAWQLAPGRTIKAMAYDGRVPGPEIRAREGERLRVVFRNGLAEPTTIHWHGVDVPNAMDGVPDITQKPVAPGETFVYEFEARPPGTRWYHTHFQEHRQMDLGLAAALIIDPATREPAAYDREVTLVLDDWAAGTGPTLPPTREGTAGGRGSRGGMMGGMMRGGGMMSGRGMGGMMGGGMMRRSAAHEPPYDTMTINGKAYPATEPLSLKKGERVRLRIINASAEHTHVVRLAGHRLRVTHTDGNPLAEPVQVDGIPVAPSERYDALLVAEHPGAWFLYCTQPGHATAGEQMLVAYDGHATRKPGEPELDVSNLALWHYGRGRGKAVLPEATGSSRSFDLTLSGGMMGHDDWTINGKVYPHTDPLPMKRGDRAVVRFRNMSPEAHPMHLHGQSFKVLAINGVRHPDPLVKDSVDVEAHMGSAVIEFTAHNPGDWFFHCHKPMHMDGGMISLVKIG